MRRTTQFRYSLSPSLRGVVGAVLFAGLAAMTSFRASAQQQEPAPIERRTPPAGGAQRSATAPGELARRGVRGEHLAEWMDQHRSLSPAQQQQALEREPGFRELPQPTQQRMRDRLAQLDAMPADRRQRLIARTEVMERLTVPQRAEVRTALGQLGELPQEQRRDVAHTFRALRDLPTEQRVSAFATGRYGPPLNDAQRSVLMNLLRVEPMLPPPAPTAPIVPLQPVPRQAFR